MVLARLLVAVALGLLVSQQARSQDAPWEAAGAAGAPAPAPVDGPEQCPEAASTTGSCHPHCEAVLLQAFGWESHTGGRGGESWWAALREAVPAIQAAGFTHAWLPPPSKSVAPQGYMPGQLYNLNSSYGSQGELAALTQALLAAGVTPVGDIVVNHRSADEQDEQGRWMIYRDDVPHPGRRLDWGKWAIVSDDPVYPGEGQPDTGEDFYPAPDLDHLNEEVQGGLADWMGWLGATLGYAGWRFDFAKGYAPRFVAGYLESSLGAGAFCVGEDWVDLSWSGGYLDYDQGAAISNLCGWLSEAQHCFAFDFPSKGVVQEAIKNTEYDRLWGSEGRGSGLLGAWPGRAVTFVDNHDTGSTQELWPWPREHVMLGYAYFLTHPGVPSVFWEHFADWGLGDQIAQLIALRRRGNITAEAELEIQAAERDMYVAKVNDRVVVKLGPRIDMGPLLPDEQEWGLAVSGTDYAVWERRGNSGASMAPA